MHKMALQNISAMQIVTRMLFMRLSQDSLFLLYSYNHLFHDCLGMVCLLLSCCLHIYLHAGKGEEDRLHRLKLQLGLGDSVL